MGKRIRYIKHPSWRVYKAAEYCKLEIEEFGLKNFDVANVESKDKNLELQLYVPYLEMDDLTKELCAALTDVKYKDTTYCVLECLDLFMDVTNRQLLEVMLLNNRSLEEICDIMGCSDSFALTYKSLFFDTTVFKTNVDRIVYVKEGTAGSDATQKNAAVDRGEEYIKIKAKVPNSKLSIDNLLADTLVTAFTYMNRNVTNDDVASQEIAQGWANTMLKFSQELRKTGVQENTIQDLVIALQTATAPKRSIDELD